MNNSTTSAIPLAGLPDGPPLPSGGRSPDIVDDLMERGVESELAGKIAHNLRHTHCKFSRWASVFGCSDLDAHDTIQWLRSRGLW